MAKASGVQLAEQRVVRAAVEWGRNLQRLAFVPVAFDQPSCQLVLALGELAVAKDAALAQERADRQRALREARAQAERQVQANLPDAADAAQAAAVARDNFPPLPLPADVELVALDPVAKLLPLGVSGDFLPHVPIPGHNPHDLETPMEGN